MAPTVTADRFAQAARRLREADRMLRDPTHLDDGVWSRSTGWLIRLGLEHALAGLWVHHVPELVAARMRSQLLVLPHLVDASTAHTAASLWTSLSRVAHHHAYELAPTAAELRGWHGQAVDVARALTTACHR